LEVNILEVSILKVNILEVDILEIDILEVDILEVDVATIKKAECCDLFLIGMPERNQGCHMVCVQTQNTKLGKFWRAL
jgi:hypothetical protein